MSPTRDSSPSSPLTPLTQHFETPKTAGQEDWALPLEVLAVVAEWVVHDVMDNFVPSALPVLNKITPLLQTCKPLSLTILPILYRRPVFHSPADLSRLFRFLTRPAITSYDHLETLVVRKAFSQIPQMEAVFGLACVKLGERLREHWREGRARAKGVLVALPMDCPFLAPIYTICFPFPLLRLDIEIPSQPIFHIFSKSCNIFFVSGSISFVSLITPCLPTLCKWPPPGYPIDIHLTITSGLPSAFTPARMDGIFTALKDLAGRGAVREVVVKLQVPLAEHFFCPTGMGGKYVGMDGKIKLARCKGECALEWERKGRTRGNQAEIDLRRAYPILDSGFVQKN